MKCLLIAALLLAPLANAAEPQTDAEIDIAIAAEIARLEAQIEAMEIELGLKPPPAKGCSCPVMETCNGSQEWVWWCSQDCCVCYRFLC